MNVRFLETFIWIAKLRSFSLAADKLLTTQQGASARIAALERDLQVRLFQRDVRDVRLTAEGRLVLERAEVIVRNVMELRSQIKDPRTLRGSITIGAIDTINLTWLPELLKTAHEQFPSVTFSVRSETSTSLAQDLLDGRIDLALLTGPAHEAGVSSLPLCSYGSVWVASPKLGLSEKPLRLDEIADYRLLSVPDVPGLQASDLQTCPEPAPGPAGVFTSNSLATIIRLAVEGMGVTALPAAVIETQLANGELQRLTVLPPLPPLAVHAAWLNDIGNLLPEMIAATAKSVAALYGEFKSSDVYRIYSN